MIKEISNHIEQIVGQMDNKIVLQYDATNERSNTCSTKWSRVGKPIVDEFSNELFITDVELDEWIKTSGSNDANGVYSLPIPYFIGGTRISANREWTISTPNLMDKTPIIWLLHDINYTKFGRENVFDFESDLRIFFLDETDIKNYYTKDHTENVVLPMSELCAEFIRTIENNRQYETLEQYEIKNFTRFGVERENGMFQNIIDANLSGVELRIKLKKYKLNCNC